MLKIKTRKLFDSVEEWWNSRKRMKPNDLAFVFFYKGEFVGAKAGEKKKIHRIRKTVDFIVGIDVEQADEVLVFHSSNETTPLCVLNDIRLLEFDSLCLNFDYHYEKKEDQKC